jgi:hypothetical protein
MAAYGTDAVQWQRAGTLIKQQVALRDRDLLAVNSLKKQIERSESNLKKADCAEGQPSPAIARNRSGVAR